jgi:hypothetical protein
MLVSAAVTTSTRSTISMGTATAEIAKTVVATSVASAASCWLLVPLLRRAAPQWWD